MGFDKTGRTGLGDNAQVEDETKPTPPPQPSGPPIPILEPEEKE